MRHLLILSMALLLMGGACSTEKPAYGGGPPVDLGTAIAAGAFPAQPVREPAVGALILSTDATPRVEMLAKGRYTVPVAGSDDLVLLFESDVDPRAGSIGLLRTFRFDPATGKQSMVPNWHADPELEPRLVSGSGGWVVVSQRSSDNSDDETSTLNIMSGRRRTIITGRRASTVGEMSISRGLVVWSDYVTGSASDRQQVKLFDVQTGKQHVLIDEPYPAQRLSLGPAHVGGRTVVWTSEPGGNAADALFVLNIDDRSLRRFAVDPRDYVKVDGISDDGRYLFWSQERERRLATDLMIGETVHYADAEHVAVGGASAGFSGTVTLSRDAASRTLADGGLYNARTGEVRPLGERADCLCLTVGMKGGWFVWQEAAPLPNDPTSEPIPFGPFRFMRP